MENKKSKIFKEVFEKYGFYAVALLVVLSISFIIVFTSLNNSVTPVSNQGIVFEMPMENCEVLKWYSDTELMYNETLNQWESHKSLDISSENQDVFAVANGTCLSVETTYDNGTIVKISHADGFVSVYSSLSSDVSVKVGDSVLAGQVIAKTDCSANNELLLGEHLRFELFLNSVAVDPSSYMTFENK